MSRCISQPMSLTNSPHSLNTMTIGKNTFLAHNLTYIRSQYAQNQDVWRQNGVKMSPGPGGVFQLVKEVTFRA
jgi:hypothetical protein